MKLVKEKVIPPFCDMLQWADLHVIYVVLKGITNMLNAAANEVRQLEHQIEECGGMFQNEEELDQLY